MTAGHLTQDDFDDLSALLDGELSPRRAGEVEGLVQSDPHWRAAWQELQAVDEALDAYGVPAAPRDLPERIIAAARRLGRTRPVILRIARWAGPAAAAAAAIVIAVALASRTTPPIKTEPIVAEPPVKAGPLDGLDKEDRFVVANLPFFKVFGVLENLDTLKAIEQLDQR